MLILVSMLDDQSQVSNFMFSYIDGGTQFRARETLSLQAQEGTPLPLNWTATIIPSACHTFNLINLYIYNDTHCRSLGGVCLISVLFALWVSTGI